MIYLLLVLRSSWRGYSSTKRLVLVSGSGAAFGVGVATPPSFPLASIYILSVHLPRRQMFLARGPDSPNLAGDILQEVNR